MENVGKALVSVIVPIYNVEKFLDRCLNSISEQTFRQIEILLIDDGSTDNSKIVCQKHVNADKRMKYFYKKNGGLSDARNYGLDMATAEYVVFIDSDDYVEKNFVEKLYTTAIKDATDVVVAGFSWDFECGDKMFDVSLHDDNTIISGRELLKRVLEYKDGYGYVVAWNKLYKRKLFDSEKFPYGKLYEDEFINYRLFWNVKSISLVDIPLYHYVQRSGSIKNSSLSFKNLDTQREFYVDRIDFYRQKDRNLYDLSNSKYRKWIIGIIYKNRKNLSGEYLNKLQKDFRKSVKEERSSSRNKSFKDLSMDIVGYFSIKLASFMRYKIIGLKRRKNE